MRTLTILVACVLGLAQLGGCVAYEPVPAYPPPATTFERAWNAALDALDDTGVQTMSADRAAGRIRGIKNRTDVFVYVARQDDGNIRVEIEARSLQGEDAGLARRISEAYKRRIVP
jgi:hypothetical protein